MPLHASRFWKDCRNPAAEKPYAPGEAESVRAVAEYYAARAREYDLTAGYEDPVAEPLRE